jgi:transcriptional regulator with XRE-family HTH domain
MKMILNKREEIGKKLKERRQQLNLEQADLQDYANISIATLSNIERGKANFTIDKLLSIMEVLGLELELKIR